LHETLCGPESGNAVWLKVAPCHVFVVWHCWQVCGKLWWFGAPW